MKPGGTGFIFGDVIVGLGEVKQPDTFKKQVSFTVPASVLLDQIEQTMVERYEADV